MRRWINFFILATLGVTIAALGLNIFIIPNSLLDGGVVGLSLILAHVTSLNVGVYLILINLPFLFIGRKNIGFRFFIKASYSIVLYAFLSEKLKDIYVVNHDLMLAAVAGGVLLGFGIGLVLLAGGCTDGTEVIGLLISKKTSLSVGQIILFINLIIFSIGGFIFGVDKAIYSLLTYYIVAKVMDMVSTGLEAVKACLIITNPENIKVLSTDIRDKLGRTSTLLEGKGFLTGDKAILYTVVTKIEIPEIKEIINDRNINAFITVSDISEVIGKHIKKTKGGNSNEENSSRA